MRVDSLAQIRLGPGSGFEFTQPPLIREHDERLAT
jgi:hypothetical protein